MRGLGVWIMGWEQDGQQLKERGKEAAEKVGDGLSRFGRAVWGKAKDIANSEQVDLAGKATKDALGRVAHATGLARLDLSHNPLLTDRDLGVVNGLRSLTHLDLGHNPKLTDNGLSVLQGKGNLQHLNLENTLITGAALTMLPHTALVSLVLRNDRNLNISNLAHLRNFGALERLDLSQNSQITDAALPHLKKLAHVKDLDLRGTSLSDRAVDELKHTLPNARIRH